MMKKIIAMVFSLGLSLSFAGTVTDADGNKYKTVRIGKMEWMAEDSRFETSGSRCVEEDANPDNCVRKYDSGFSKVCPQGYRLPTWADIVYMNDMFLPENYDQMTDKQKRHARPEIEKQFENFFDSIGWPKHIYSSSQKSENYYTVFVTVGGFPQVRTFIRNSEKNPFGGGSGFVPGPPNASAKVRCLKEIE
ncbi:MAG: hypothetical protein HUK20_05155 [Fibrobacter sp.]|nr:hypothetical protein [Fibrobacter sp.]